MRSGAAARSTCSTSRHRWPSRCAISLTSGFRPKGTFIYSAVADEEALGTYGAQWLTEHVWDDVKSDFLVTELGGRASRWARARSCRS